MNTLPPNPPQRAATWRVAMVLLLGLGCSAGPKPPPPAQQKAKAATALTLRAVTPEPVRHRANFVVTGTLMPVADVHLGFKVGGTMERILVQRGQKVSRGDTLLKLDTRDVTAGIAQAQAAVQTAETQAAMAKDAVDRLEKLRESGSISEHQLTQLKFQWQMAESQAGQARAALRSAQLQLDHHSLRSPIDGTVLMAPDTPGMIVGPGTPLVQVSDLRCVRLSVTLPPEAAGRVVQGSPVPMEAQGRVAQGTLTRVMPAFEPRGHRLPVEAEVCGAEAAGLANAFVRATFSGAQVEDAHRVPVTAFERQDEGALYLVGEGGRAQRRDVRILQREPAAVVVAGLSLADRIIELPPEDLVDGAEVKVRTEAGGP